MPQEATKESQTPSSEPSGGETPSQPTPDQSAPSQPSQPSPGGEQPSQGTGSSPEDVWGSLVDDLWGSSDSGDSGSTPSGEGGDAGSQTEGGGEQPAGQEEPKPADQSTGTEGGEQPSETPAKQEEPEQPSGEPEKPTEPEQPEQPEQPAEPQQPQGQTWENLKQQAIEKLSEQYGLSEEAAERLENEPGNWGKQDLPKLAAKMHVDIFESVLNAVTQQLPHLISEVNQRQAERQSFENVFYEKWPQLRGKEQTVNQVVEFYRRFNPKASQQEVIEKAGEQAALLLNLPVNGQGNGSGQPQGNGAEQPQSGKSGTVTEPVPPEHQPEGSGRGFSPASPGGTPSIPSGGSSENPFEEFLEDD